MRLSRATFARVRLRRRGPAPAKGMGRVALAVSSWTPTGQLAGHQEQPRLASLVRPQANSCLGSKPIRDGPTSTWPAQRMASAWEPRRPVAGRRRSVASISDRRAFPLVDNGTKASSPRRWSVLYASKRGTPKRAAGRTSGVRKGLS